MRLQRYAKFYEKANYSERKYVLGHVFVKKTANYFEFSSKYHIFVPNILLFFNSNNHAVLDFLPKNICYYVPYDS